MDEIQCMRCWHGECRIWCMHVASLPIPNPRSGRGRVNAWHGVWGSALHQKVVMIARLIRPLPTLFQCIKICWRHGYSVDPQDRSRTVQMSNLESNKTLKCVRSSIRPPSVCPRIEVRWCRCTASDRRTRSSFSKPSSRLESSKIWD